MTFNFKGISPEKMGLKIIAASGPQRAPCETEIISIPGRQNPLTRTKTELQTTEMTIQLLVTVPKRIREIFSWLSGSGKLIFSDEPDKYYSVISNNVISLERIGGEIQSFEVKFICEPFAYSVYNPMDYKTLELDDNNLRCILPVYVNGTAGCEPLIYLKFAGKLSITVNDDPPFTIITEGGTWSTEAFDDSAEEKIYKYKCTEQEIYIDTESRIAYTPTKKIVTCQTCGMFPTLKHGDNSLWFELSSEALSYGQLTYKRSNQNLTILGLQKNERWH